MAATAIRQSPTRLGSVTRVVAVDGLGGAGKSTLAGILASSLGAAVVHTDDFATATEPLDWWPRMIEEVRSPLSADLPARFQRHDWDAGRRVDWVEVQPGGIVIVEGVTSSRREFGGFLSLAIWVETSAEERMRRGLERDGFQACDRWRE